MVAGAGSGKTTSLVKALDFVVRSRGADLMRRGQQVACITYTENAVAEITGDVGENPACHVSTIHSFLWKLVRPFQADIGAWVACRLEEKRAELIQQRDAFGPRVGAAKRARTEKQIARYQEEGAALGRVTRVSYFSAARYAEGVLGHDDIIKMVPALIMNRPLLGEILAGRYPFFLVDESQDTFPVVVDALRLVAERYANRFCLGFFGDPMQRIYLSGVGEVALSAGWRRITKPENFRCPSRVLSVINTIRAKGDGLVQTGGRTQLVDGAALPVEGSARLFVLPTDAHRVPNLERVRQQLAAQDGDAGWTCETGDSGLRILVIEHRMAAARLGFSGLFAAFRDGAPASLADGFRDGNAWPLEPFREALLPLASAISTSREAETLKVLRDRSLRLRAEAFGPGQRAADVLQKAKEDVLRLARLLAVDGSSTIRDVLRFVVETKLVELEDRLRDYVLGDEVAGTAVSETESSREGEGEDDEESERQAIARFFECPAREVWGYEKYQADLSHYSTQQGVKGAEFRRVLVVLDDDEGRGFQFSYDKLLGLKPPSKTDLENREQGKESIVERTRRLFYVCCSRATEQLAVVLFTADVKKAVKELEALRLFEPENIHTLEAL